MSGKLENNWQLLDARSIRLVAWFILGKPFVAIKSDV